MPGTMGKSVADAERGRAGMLVAHRVDMMIGLWWRVRPASGRSCCKTSRARLCGDAAAKLCAAWLKCSALQHAPRAPREKVPPCSAGVRMYGRSYCCDTYARGMYQVQYVSCLLGPTSCECGVIFLVARAFHAFYRLFLLRFDCAAQFLIG